MKAAIVEKPNCLVVRDIPEPEIENDYQAKCEVLFGATCTGTDLHIISDSLPWETPYPCVLGHESIGRILEPGPKAHNYKAGDLIQVPAITDLPGIGSSWGGFSEFVLITDYDAMRDDANDVSGINPRVLPPNTDPAAATMLLTWCEGYAYLKSMGIGPGASCLLLGSGGNGLAMTAAARALGAARIVMSGNESRRESADAVGIDHLVDYRSADRMEQLKAAGPDGYDFIIDIVGTQGLLDEMLDLVRRGGSVGTYGLDDAFDACTLTPRFRPSFTWFDGEKDVDGAIDEVIPLMQSGTYDARHWLNCENPFELDDIAQVYDDLKNRRLPHAKAVIRVRG